MSSPRDVLALTDIPLPRLVRQRQCIEELHCVRPALGRHVPDLVNGAALASCRRRGRSSEAISLETSEESVELRR
jgi:hypothetical protein